MFRRQIAHVAVSADLLQRALPKLYGFLSLPHVLLHTALLLRSRGQCCVEQLAEFDGMQFCCSNAPFVLRCESEPAQHEFPHTTYFSSTFCA